MARKRSKSTTRRSASETPTSYTRRTRARTQRSAPARHRVERSALVSLVDGSTYARTNRRRKNSRRRGEPGLPVEYLDWRNDVRPTRKRTKKRMPRGMVSAPTRNENAPARKATNVCARKKSEKRAVILATGYGGINGRRNYKEHTSCR